MIEAISVEACKANVMSEQDFSQAENDKLHRMVLIYLENINDTLSKAKWKPLKYKERILYKGYSICQHDKTDRLVIELIRLYTEKGWDCWWSNTNRGIVFNHPYAKKASWWQRIF